MIVAADEPVPTVAGVITLGLRPRDFLPGDYVHFLRLAGTGLSSPVIDDALVEGPIGDLIPRIEDKLSSHNRVAVDITSQPLETRTPAYPMGALQQLVRNAVLHRTYESTNAPVRVYWFDDRIEILNPGGPYGAVSAETFGQPGLTDYRNPVLAEVMQVLGFVNRFGVGIATARSALQKESLPPPEFEVSSNWVLCRVRGRPRSGTK